jgi:hypothetical protein
MKKCILYEGKICNDCGECMRCDLDPNKICDNCGKCLRRSDDDEFQSIVVNAEDIYGKKGEEPEEDLFEDDEELSEEEKAFNAFLDAPIDLHVPEPIEVDPELAAKWDEILRKYEEEEKKNEAPDEPEPEIAIRGSRKRRHR